MNFLDRFTSIDDLLVQLLERLGGVTEEDTHFFSYPSDGSRATLAVGTTTIDFMAGTVKVPAGTVSSLGNSLRARGREFCRSLSLQADQDIIIQIGTKSKIPIFAGTWFKVAHLRFEELNIITSSPTDIFVIACTNPDSIEMAGESYAKGVTGREERQSISTDKDINFTGAITTGNVEEENISGLAANEITVTDVVIQSDQPLDYRLIFFGTDGFADADMDDDYFTEFVELDIDDYGIRIAGAGQYYYAATGLMVNYCDWDGSKELHIALQNLSTTSKNAGATGEVMIRIGYIPRI